MRPFIRDRHPKPVPRVPVTPVDPAEAGQWRPRVRGDLDPPAALFLTPDVETAFDRIADQIGVLKAVIVHLQGELEEVTADRDRLAKERPDLC